METTPMKSSIALIVALSTSIAVSTAHGQDGSLPSGATPPDLTGTWEIVRSEGAFGTEFVGTLPRAQIVIEEQQGAVFIGFIEYELADEHPDFHDGSNPVRMAKEPFTGLIDWDNRSLTMVERGDTSVWNGTLLNAETMAVVYFEPGEHAFIARQILVRH
jgi:hypothetical protein